MNHLAQFDVVKVPFPFTELPFTKRRPAVVLSNSRNFDFAEGSAKCVLAMITSSSHKPWPLDQSLVLAKIGRLSRKDIAALSANLTKLFAQQ
ncbi:MAG: hypothetical protein OHK0011_21460 [Turneriella sp.]